MNNQRNTLLIQVGLTALFSLPPAAAAKTCPVALDAPALLAVEAASGITLSTASGGAVVLEASPSHLVIAARRPGVVWLETPANCDFQASLTRTEVREQEMSLRSGDRRPAVVTSFHPLGIATPLLTLIDLGHPVPGKEEDHDIDPDPDVQGRVPTKEEDHDIDPDPDLKDLKDPGCGLPTKEEDHDIDPDPDQPLAGGACDWARDWSAAADLVRRLGPGWYFVVKGGEVTQEIFVDPREDRGRTASRRRSDTLR